MRVITAEQLSAILSTLPNGARVIASGNFATPRVLLAALDESVPRYRLHMLNAHGPLPDREGVRYETTFVGPAMRGHHRLDYIPCRLSLVPVLFHQRCRPQAVLLHTSARHRDTVSLGIEVNVLPAAIEAARSTGALVIAQANRQMPYTYGDAKIHESQIDYLVEVDEPVPTNTVGDLGDTAHIIGQSIAARIADGATLQLGIGAIPDAVLTALRGHRGLKIWTEMFSDGVAELHRSGCLDDQLPVTSSFLFGSQDLYDWVHFNQQVHMLRTDIVNDPAQIARQVLMTSVNAALQVDLFDQANASRIGNRIYSGFGGATDFVVGAQHARGGQSFIALPSWHAKAQQSTIVGKLTEPVTSVQHTAVATEQGIAQMFGHSQSEQAANLIAHAAHPDAREQLREQAAQFGLAPGGTG